MSDQYTDRYNNLNPQQQKAVDTLEGPVLVVAGPGSGKTELLSLRVANILRTQDVSPSNILCLTYTEAAATNMRQRLAGLVGPAAYQVAIHTFHSFATEIINRFPEYFYNGASFQPADELTQIELLENIFNGLSYSNPLSSKHQQAYTYLGDVQNAIADLKKAGITPDQFEQIMQQNSQILEKISPAIEAVFTPRVSKQTIEQIQELIGQLSVLYQEESDDESGLGRPESLAKSLGTSLNLALASALELDKTSPISEWKRKYTTKDSQDRIMLKDVQRLPKMRALADVYRQYRHDLHAAGYFDFDDMLLDVLEALSSQAELRYALQEQYQYVLVDEFQDTNDAQMRLINYVTDAPVYEGRPNIMAVGDDDQAIYKFQGAKIANIQQFREHYQDVTQIVLVKNYRSGQAILDLARHVIV